MMRAVAPALLIGFRPSRRSFRHGLLGICDKYKGDGCSLVYFLAFCAVTLVKPSSEGLRSKHQTAFHVSIRLFSSLFCSGWTWNIQVPLRGAFISKLKRTNRTNLQKSDAQLEMREYLQTKPDNKEERCTTWKQGQTDSRLLVYL